MALGGGTWISQNKALPGVYANFVSVTSANAALSDRGIATMPLALDWGPVGEMFEVTNEDFQKNSMKFFGYEYDADELKPMRDLFLGIRLLYAYRLGGGTKASNTYATARYEGTRGNAIKTGVQANVDKEGWYDVTTYLGTTKVDVQTVQDAAGLEDNDYVTFDKTATLSALAPLAMSGGTDEAVTAGAYQDYLDKAEGYSYNVMGVCTTDDTVKSLFAAYNKRVRDEVGKKFQLVVYDYPAADYMGVISVKNKCLDGAYKGSVYTSAGVYTVTIGGTPADGDKITVAGTEVTLDAAGAASVTAAAAAVAAALGSMAAYTVTSDAGVITFTEKTGHYGAGAPTANIVSTAGTVAVATVTEAGSTVTTIYPNEAAAVYWVTGEEAGAAVNESLQNNVYDGEYELYIDYTQSQLIAALQAGEFVFHSENGEPRVLDDINTFVSITDTQGDVFKDNQTIRVIDQLANDDAEIFKTVYLGNVPNDSAGRDGLKGDLIKIRKELQSLRAIEDFADSDVVVERGDTKKSVLVTGAITVTNTMSKLYMTTTIA